MQSQSDNNIGFGITLIGIMIGAVVAILLMNQQFIKPLHRERDQLRAEIARLEQLTVDGQLPTAVAVEIHGEKWLVVAKTANSSGFKVTFHGIVPKSQDHPEYVTAVQINNPEWENGHAATYRVPEGNHHTTAIVMYSLAKGGKEEVTIPLKK